MKFNLGKLNTCETKKFNVTGAGDISYKSELSQYLLEKYQEKTNSIIDYASNIKGIVEITAITFSIKLDFQTQALASNLVYSDKGLSDLDYNAYAIGAMLGEEYLELKGINLAQGQEIEIDMCNLTITVNGENAIHLLATECDFFDFLPGVNEIDIAASGGTDMQISTYWKDKWL